MDMPNTEQPQPPDESPKHDREHYRYVDDVDQSHAEEPETTDLDEDEEEIDDEEEIEEEEEEVGKKYKVN